MNDEHFEQRLRNQPMRHVPADWREQILSASQAAVPRHTSPDPRHSFFSTLNHQLSTLLWPHPKAWAGLAAAWLVILALNLASTEKTEAAAIKTLPPSPEMVAALREQHRLLGELVGRTDLQDVERPKVAPLSPRSERAVELLVA